MQTDRILFDYVTGIAPLPVAFPGVSFDKPADNRYIEVIHLPNTPINYDWGDDATVERGLLQINVHWSRNVGIIAANDVARGIAARFRKDTIIDGLQIDASPTIGQWLDDFIPVRISYRSI